MGSLRIGTTLLDTIGQLKLGSSNVLAVYDGNVQVFPAPTTTTTTTTTSTTSTTTTAAPTTTSTTTSTTTAAPTTSTTTTTTTAAPTTSTTTTTTTAAPTTTTTTTSTTTTTTTVGFETYSVKVDTNAYPSICSQSFITVYTALGYTITTGTAVFTDSSLTTYLINYNYILEVGSGEVFAIGSGTGVIGTTTGNSC